MPINFENTANGKVVLYNAAQTGTVTFTISFSGASTLVLSAVAWLAGLDELVATGSSGREVARFEGVDATTRNVFGILLPSILGLGPLLIGAGVWSWRRSGR